MANLVDMANMKHRVAATEAMLSAAAQDGRERNERLLDFLERVEKNLVQKQEQISRVEKNLVQKQEQISRLEKEQSRSLEENQLLRTLLNDMLTMAETTLERSSQVASDDLEQLIDRLGTIASTAKQDGEEDADSADAKDSDASPADSAKAAEAKPAENADHADAKPAESAEDTEAKPAESAEDTEAKPAESAENTEAKPAESAEEVDAAPARKRRVSKVLSLFGSA